jgi:hypothetical protein
MSSPSLSDTPGEAETLLSKINFLCLFTPEDRHPRFHAPRRCQHDHEYAHPSSGESACGPNAA